MMRIGPYAAMMDAVGARVHVDSPMHSISSLLSVDYVDHLQAQQP